MQATLESQRKLAVPGKPNSEELGGQLVFAVSAQAPFQVPYIIPTLKSIVSNDRFARVLIPSADLSPLYCCMCLCKPDFGTV